MTVSSRSRSARRRVRGLSLAAAVVSAALVLSGCSTWFGSASGATDGQTAGASTPTGEKVDAALQPFYDQSLNWTSCNGSFECATATVLAGAPHVVDRRNRPAPRHHHVHGTPHRIATLAGLRASG